MRKASTELIDERWGPTAGERAGGEGEVVFVDQYGPSGRRHGEGFAVDGAEEVRCGDAAQPLQQPALVQAGGGSQRACIGRTQLGEGPEQPEAIADVDEERYELALLVAPDPEGVKT